MDALEMLVGSWRNDACIKPCISQTRFMQLSGAILPQSFTSAGPFAGRMTASLNAAGHSKNWATARVTFGQGLVLFTSTLFEPFSQTLLELYFYFHDLKCSIWE